MRSETYVIKGGQVGRERLRVLSRVLAPSTGALLDRLPIPPQASVLDVGCGGGDVTLAWARRLPDGHVIGVDVDATKLAMAREDAAEAGADNVEFRLADATHTDLGSEQYDIVYARFVLCHLPSPEAVVRRLVDALVPGGLIVVEDTDIDGGSCFPPSPAFERCRELYNAAVRGRGGDPNIGWRLPQLLRDAGATDVALNVVQPAGLSGEVKTIQALTLAASRDAIVAAELATGEEVDRTVAELKAFAARPDTVVSAARIVQSWARKPGGATIGR